MPNIEHVSIALAVYNGEKYLPELLASLEKQTLKPFELVVLDDCSSDNSLEIIQNYALSFSKKIYNNSQNEGPVFTFKKLAALCSGDYIAFCDQDDIWMSHKLEWSVSELKKLSGNIPGLVFTDLSVIRENGELLYTSYWKMKHIYPHRLSFNDLLYGNFVIGCTILINKKMREELTKMPLNIVMHDWWIALIAYSIGGYRIINAATVLYRSHQKSVTDKNKISLVNIFIKQYKERSSFLNENISQAIEFRKVYSTRLNKRYSHYLNKFISLAERNMIYKIFVRNLNSIKRRIKR